MYLCALQMRGSLQPGQPWDIVVDLFFYREPEEAKDETEEAAAGGDAFGGVPDAYGAQGLPAPPGAQACRHGSCIVAIMRLCMQKSLTQEQYVVDAPVSRHCHVSPD